MNPPPPTQQQLAIKQLESSGYRFVQWIAATPDADNQPVGDAMTAVMVKHGTTRYGRIYIEVGPDGEINL